MLHIRSKKMEIKVTTAEVAYENNTTEVDSLFMTVNAYCLVNV